MTTMMSPSQMGSLLADIRPRGLLTALVQLAYRPTDRTFLLALLRPVPYRSRYYVHRQHARPRRGEASEAHSQFGREKISY